MLVHWNRFQTTSSSFPGNAVFKYSWTAVTSPTWMRLTRELLFIVDPRVRWTFFFTDFHIVVFPFFLDLVLRSYVIVICIIYLVLGYNFNVIILEGINFCRWIEKLHCIVVIEYNCTIKFSCIEIKWHLIFSNIFICVWLQLYILISLI